MTKHRDPVTYENALARIVGKITAERAGQLVSRSLTTISDWMNPDSPKLPTLAQAETLDLAYFEAGGEGMPLAEAYLQRLDNARADGLACRLQLASLIATGVQECGEAWAHALKVVQPGSGPREIMRAQAELGDAQSAVAATARHLSIFQQSGAGPDLDICGGAQR